jgi:transcriptional regulator with XRE-family HTH domain
MGRRPLIKPTSAAAIGRRLALARMALGLTTTQICARMGSISTGSAWSNYEMGRRRIALDHAIALCDAGLGLTLDWIYRGEEGMLDPKLRKRLQELALLGPTH